MSAIALRFFDAQGDLACSELDERVSGISLKELRHVDRVAGMAGSMEKLGAVGRERLDGGRYANCEKKEKVDFYSLNMLLCLHPA